MTALPESAQSVELAEICTDACASIAVAETRRLEGTAASSAGTARSSWLLPIAALRNATVARTILPAIVAITSALAAQTVLWQQRPQRVRVGHILFSGWCTDLLDNVTTAAIMRGMASRGAGGHADEQVRLCTPPQCTTHHRSRAGQHSAVQIARVHGRRASAMGMTPHARAASQQGNRNVIDPTSTAARPCRAFALTRSVWASACMRTGQ